MDNFKGEDFSSVFFDTETPDSKQVVKAMRVIEKLQKKIMEITSIWKEKENARTEQAEEANNKKRELIDLLQKKDDEILKLNQLHASTEAQTRYDSIQKDQEKPKVFIFSKFLFLFFKNQIIFFFRRCLWSQSSKNLLYIKN